LKDASFEVKRGEVVGIIGRNGAGKTTLLKILARITDPTTGYAEVHGRVGSLLEVGTGFHPELTGRENIYLSGAILGMKKHEIDKKFDEIVAFAEIEKFIDTPVKYYSSGMYVRLAFAVAAHLEPEILLVDEVLAVGDISFQKKCLGKMQDVSQEGHTVLFVSHNMQAVIKLTQKAILLDAGEVRKIGSTRTVVEYYHAFVNKYSQGGTVDLRNADRAGGDQKIEFTEIILRNSKGEITNSFSPQEPIIITLKFLSHIYSDDFEIGYSVRTLDGVILFTSSSSDQRSLFRIDSGLYQIHSVIDPNYLKPGRYYLQVGITCGVLRDLIPEAIQFEVRSSELKSQSPLFSLPGYLYFEYSWDIPKKIG